MTYPMQEDEMDAVQIDREARKRNARAEAQQSGEIQIHYVDGIDTSRLPWPMVLAKAARQARRTKAEASVFVGPDYVAAVKPNGTVRLLLDNIEDMA